MDAEVLKSANLRSERPSQPLALRPERPISTRIRSDTYISEHCNLA